VSLTQRAVVLERWRVAHASTSAELLADSQPLQRLVAVARAPGKEARSATTVS
jgi:branched-chain amino acid transport system ATP-binding protein